jgi:hypothetical protein
MTKVDYMGFLLGLLVGVVSAIGLFVFLAYWLCSRSSNMALARCLNGIAQALAHKPKSSEPLTPGENGEAMDGAKAKR